MVIYTRANCQGSTFEQLCVGRREPRLLIKVKEGPRKCIVYSSVHFPSRNSSNLPCAHGLKKEDIRWKEKKEWRLREKHLDFWLESMHFCTFAALRCAIDRRSWSLWKWRKRGRDESCFLSRQIEFLRFVVSPWLFLLSFLARKSEKTGEELGKSDRENGNEISESFSSSLSLSNRSLPILDGSCLDRINR